MISFKIRCHWIKTLKGLQISDLCQIFWINVWGSWSLSYQSRAALSSLPAEDWKVVWRSNCESSFLFSLQVWPRTLAAWDSRKLSSIKFLEWSYRMSWTESLQHSGSIPASHPDVRGSVLGIYSLYCLDLSLVKLWVMNNGLVLLISSSREYNKKIL